jgi:hypothetical protein
MRNGAKVLDICLHTRERKEFAGVASPVVFTEIGSMASTRPIFWRAKPGPYREPKPEPIGIANQQPRQFGGRRGRRRYMLLVSLDGIARAVPVPGRNRGHRVRSDERNSILADA